MQRIIIWMCLVLALSGCEKVVDVKEIQTRNGIVYLPNSKTPFSGRVEDYYENGNLRYEAIHKVKDGEQKSVVRNFHDNGQVSSEITSWNGVLWGLEEQWYENGQIMKDTKREDGEANPVTRGWHENGQMSFMVPTKNLKIHGLVQEWYENGQMKSENTYENGKREGIVRKWYENGQMKSEITSKNDEMNGLVRSWDENGNLTYEGTAKNGVAQ